jgi:hypothetical protein
MVESPLHVVDIPSSYMVDISFHVSTVHFICNSYIFIYHFAGKIWVPDSWYADVPDTFALLPRNVSDIYYNLDAQYSPEFVMCLGGPNFDPHTLSDANLAAKGYKTYEIRMIQKDLCLWKYKRKYRHNFERKQNYTWCDGGTSEVYLKRKLVSADTCCDR